MRRAAAAVGIFAMLYLSIVLLYIFTLAYLSPEKAAKVTVNDFGEADLELVMLAGLTPLMLFAALSAAMHIYEDASEYRIIRRVRAQKT